jgi:hypothetical protein
MQLISNHLVLVSAPTIEKGSTQVKDFFFNSLLVRYDKIDIRTEKCHRGNDKEFKVALQNSLATNRKTLCNLVEEFKKTGFQKAEDIIKVKHGYPSKMLHIISHFLDGFIGIDSVFYNLIEDSHWISEATARGIEDAPKEFWLIHLDCYSETPEQVGIIQQ